MLLLRTAHALPPERGYGSDRETSMLLHLLERFLSWLKRPFYDRDDPLEEYWERKRLEEERRSQ